ncbi:unnamed protein product [Penicillium glandicola]
MPVISRADFEAQWSKVNMADPDKANTGFLSVIYGILAVAVLSFPTDHDVFLGDAVAEDRGKDLAAHFFQGSVASLRELRYVTSHPEAKPMDGVEDHGQSLNHVVALALQGSFLSSIGNQADAWIAIGQAARHGQDIGLHRSSVHMGFSEMDQQRRQRLWWSIYTLDSALSTTLGRPVAIRDLDCDVELPAIHTRAESPSYPDHSGFTNYLPDMVAAVKKVKDNRHFRNIPRIRGEVLELNLELQTWATLEVPRHVKSAEQGSLNAQRLIALSGYFSALMLLYRYLVPNPHRASPLDGTEAISQSARAATNCIRITARIVECLPICPDLLFHAQHVFTSSMILLHCIWRSEDDSFIGSVSKDIEVALHSLRSLQHIWPEAKKLMCLLETYLELILNCLEKGADPQRCIFHHEKHERTGLEWMEDTETCLSDPFRLDLADLMEPLMGDMFMSPSLSPSVNRGNGHNSPGNARETLQRTSGPRRGGYKPESVGLAKLATPDYQAQGFNPDLWESLLSQSALGLY